MTAKTTSGEPVALFCADDPSSYAEQLARRSKVTYQRLADSDSYLIDGRIKIEGQDHRVLVTNVTSEPCKTEVRKQKNEAAGKAVLATGAVVLLAPLAIVGLLLCPYCY